MHQTRSIGKSILASFVGLLSFYAVYIIGSLILILVFALLSSIPVIRDLLSIFLNLRGDPPEWTIALVCVIAAWIVSLIVIEKIAKIKENTQLASKILGICLVCLNIIFLIMNLLSGDTPIFSNIVIIIAGIYMFVTAK